MADIELVIKMPEEKYKWIKENNPKADKNSIVGAIVYGTPLPKGHGDLKDADALGVQIAMIRDKYNYYGNEYESACFKSFDRAVDEIIDAPTIIEADEGEQE